MVVCQFYMKGSCKFGDRCRNEHPRNLNDYNQQYRGNNQNYGNYGNQNYNNRGGQSGFNSNYQQRGGYGNYGGGGGQQQRQDQFHWRSGQQQQSGQGQGKSVSFQNSFGTSNRYGVLDQGGGGAAGSTQKGDGQSLKPNEIIDIIKKDIEEWENGKMWPLSCYKPTRSQHCVPGFEDIIQEELRYTAYCAEKQQKFEQYKTAVASLMSTVQQQKGQLKSPNSDLTSKLVDIFKGIYQAGSNVSLGNGDTMYQALLTASGGSSTQPTAAGSTQQGSSFGTSTSTPTSSAAGGFGTTSTFGSTQGASSTSGFGSASFGKPAAPSGGGFGSAASTTGGFGSSTTGAQSSTQPPAGFFSKGGAAAAPPPTGLFGKGVAPSTGGTGLFGKGTPASTPTPTGLFGKPAAPGATAGGGLFGQNSASAAVDSTMYTPLSELTPEEKEQFEADTFTIGKIPTRPPPMELVR